MTHLHALLHGVPSLVWSGAGRWDGVDIGRAACNLSAKSEALDMKSDIATREITTVGIN
jgi:hypothetical protein